MYRGGGNPVSKATSQTRCQKCLKYGHYSYECKATVEQRPYVSRPSRMQQLMNPNLRPKLAEENPNPLLRREGLADEIISKNEEERARARSRSQPVSSDTDSVSTISTNRSPSRSPPPKRRRRDTEELKPGRRDRRLSSNHDRTSDSDRPSRGRTARDRSPRRPRMNAALRSPSPGTGRSARMGRRREDSRSRFHQDGKLTRRKSSSPHHRGRRRSESRSHSPPRRDYERARSRSGSPQFKRNRYRHDGARRRSNSRTRHERHEKPRERPRSPIRGRYQTGDGGTVTYGKAPRERSLSPYSRRLALTQALNRA